MRNTSWATLIAAALIVSGCCLTLDFGQSEPTVISETGTPARTIRRPRLKAPVKTTPAPRTVKRPGRVRPLTIPPGTSHVKIVVFTDYQCPYCRRLHPTLKRIKQQLGKRATIVLKHNPLPFHDKGVPAAIAALAAERQGKLWEMSDQLFLTPGNLLPERYSVLAQKLKLDVPRFERDMSDPALLARVEKDRAEARRLGARGTPTLFIGDRKVVGAKPYGALMKRIQDALAR